MDYKLLFTWIPDSIKPFVFPALVGAGLMWLIIKAKKMQTEIQSLKDKSVNNNLVDMVDNLSDKIEHMEERLDNHDIRYAEISTELATIKTQNAEIMKAVQNTNDNVLKIALQK